MQWALPRNCDELLLCCLQFSVGSSQLFLQVGYDSDSNFGIFVVNSVVHGHTECCSLSLILSVLMMSCSHSHSRISFFF